MSPVPLPAEPRLNPRAVPHSQKVKDMLDEERREHIFSEDHKREFYKFRPERYRDVKLGRKADPEPPLPVAGDYRPTMTWRPINGLLPFPKEHMGYDVVLRGYTMQQFDSNIKEDIAGAEQEVFYQTTGLGVDFDIGSIRTLEELDHFDTWAGLQGTYEMCADLFYNDEGFNRVSNIGQLRGRLGRDSVLVMPYAMARNRTGEPPREMKGEPTFNIEQVGRITDETLQVGVMGSNEISSYLRHGYDFSWTRIGYPDGTYRDIDYIRGYQEFAYNLVPFFQYEPNSLFTNQSEALVWGEWREGDPDDGSRGRELIGGIGWKGRFWEHVYSEFKLGWAEMDLSAPTANLDRIRRNQDGVRWEGYTRYEHNHQLHFTLGYKRWYDYSIRAINDNSMATAAWLNVGIFLPDHWFIYPGIEFTHAKSETLGIETLNWKPRIEVAYKVEFDYKIFARFEYERTDIWSGDSSPTESFRQAAGVLIQY